MPCGGSGSHRDGGDLDLLPSALQVLLEVGVKGVKLSRGQGLDLVQERGEEVVNAPLVLEVIEVLGDQPLRLTRRKNDRHPLLSKKRRKPWAGS